MRTRASRGSNKALGVATDQFETTSDVVQPPIDTIEAQIVAGEFLLPVGDFAVQVADLRLDGAESCDGFIKYPTIKNGARRPRFSDPVHRVRSLGC
jgi:hypothetical protein